MDIKKNYTVSTTHFYNIIASEYDVLMNNSKDIAIRNELANYFKKAVEPGFVLDFGGGTGLDLPWLLAGGYHVYFCEPAIEMKVRAQKLVERSGLEPMPIFLADHKSDYRVWEISTPPLEEKLHGVLANFGVLNYVQNLPLLFQKFHSMLVENGSIIAGLLYASRRELLTKYLKNFIKAVIKGEKVKIGSQYDGMRHESFLYSIRDIEKAAEKYFVIQHKLPLGRSEFLLIHLIKK